MIKSIQDFIHKYQDLIQLGDLHALLLKCPVALRGELLEKLYNSNLNWLPSKGLFAINFFGQVLGVRAPKDGIFKYGWNPERHPGARVFFKSLDEMKSALDSLDLEWNSIYAAPNTEYDHVVKVPTSFGEGWITENIFEKYNSTAKVKVTPIKD